jgi:hypothetical protein
MLHRAYTCQGIYRQRAQATAAEVGFDSLEWLQKRLVHWLTPSLPADAEAVVVPHKDH